MNIKHEAFNYKQIKQKNMNYITTTQKNEALRIATAFKVKQIKEGLKNPKNSENLNIILLEALGIKKEKTNSIFCAIIFFIGSNILNLPLLSLLFDGYSLGAAIGAAVYTFVMGIFSLCLIEI
jgi:hypothetical protein